MVGGSSPQRLHGPAPQGCPPVSRVDVAYGGRSEIGPSPRSLWQRQCSRVAPAFLAQRAPMPRTAGTRRSGPTDSASGRRSRSRWRPSPPLRLDARPGAAAEHDASQARRGPRAATDARLQCGARPPTRESRLDSVFRDPSSPVARSSDPVGLREAAEGKRFSVTATAAAPFRDGFRFWSWPTTENGRRARRHNNRTDWYCRVPAYSPRGSRIQREARRRTQSAVVVARAVYQGLHGLPTPAEGASAADGGDLENRPGGVPPGADIRTEGRDRGAPGPRVLERSRSGTAGLLRQEDAGINQRPSHLAHQPLSVSASQVTTPFSTWNLVDGPGPPVGMMPSCRGSRTRRIGPESPGGQTARRCGPPAASRHPPGAPYATQPGARPARR